MGEFDLDIDFDADEVIANSNDFDLLPAGEYQLQIVDTSVADNKRGTGKILKLVIEVVSGPYAERKIWENINFKNDNPTAQKIAQEQLAFLSKALGFAQPPRNSEEYRFKTFTAKVGISKDKTGQYSDSNKVNFKSALKKGGQPPAAKAAASAPATASQAKSPQQTAAGSRPWANR